MSEYLHGIEILEIESGGRTITTPSTSVIGLIGSAPNADEDKLPLNTPTLITKISDINNLAIGETGSIPTALRGIYNQSSPICVVVRVAEGDTATDTIVNIAGDVAVKSGVFAFLNAEEKAKYKPKILLAPFFSGLPLAGDDKKPNAIVTNLLQVAEKLRAVAVIDGPNTTRDDALTFASNINNTRAYLIDPSYAPTFARVDPNPEQQASSPLVAGAIAKRDAEKGFWWSPSNQNLNGIKHLSRPVEFTLTDATSESNLLNKAGVSTIVFTSGNYKLWGNKSPSTDNKWQFLSVRRTVDTIYDAIDSNMLWAMDRPFSKQLLGDIQNNIQAYLNTLISQGALLGGKAWVSVEDNNITTYNDGQLVVDFDIEPPAPVDRLTFKAYRNSDYVKELFK